MYETNIKNIRLKINPNVKLQFAWVRFHQLTILISSSFCFFFPIWSCRGFTSVCLRHLLRQGKIFASNLAEMDPEVCFRVFLQASAYGHENLASLLLVVFVQSHVSPLVHGVWCHGQRQWETELRARGTVVLLTNWHKYNATLTCLSCSQYPKEWLFMALFCAV